VAANGTWSYAVKQGEMPTEGVYLVKVELAQTGIQESTFPEEFTVIKGPGA